MKVLARAGDKVVVDFVWLLGFVVKQSHGKQQLTGQSVNGWLLSSCLESQFPCFVLLGLAFSLCCHACSRRGGLVLHIVFTSLGP